MSIISELKKTTVRTHQLEQDVYAFFKQHGTIGLSKHNARVAEKASMLAERFGICTDLPVNAALLHDISQVLRIDQFITAAVECGIEVLEEERLFPGLLHQKLSKTIASDIFGVNDDSILSAIECHTTLRAGASDIDLILFVADKLSWDTEDSKLFIDGIQSGLEKSLSHAALSYINYLMNSKETLKVIHPRMLEAYQDLKQKCR